MRTTIAGLGSRMRKVDAWTRAAAAKTKSREFQQMSIEQKCAYYRELLPKAPMDHPARPVMERVIRRLESEPRDSRIFQ